MSDMIERLVQRLANSWHRDDGEDAEESSGFAGSILDWSVNYGHGTATHREANREIARIQEKAELLDAQERHRR